MPITVMAIYSNGILYNYVCIHDEIFITSISVNELPGRGFPKSRVPIETPFRNNIQHLFHTNVIIISPT